jgi:hypothetical protein
MADTKVSALTAAATLTGAEQVPAVQAAASVRTTAGAIARTYKTVKVVTADVSESAAAATSVADLSMAGLAAGTYLIKGTVLWKAAATTTGITLFLDTAGAGSTQLYATFNTLTTGTTQTTGIAQTSGHIGNNTGLVEGKYQNAEGTGIGGLVGVQNANSPTLTIIDGLLILTGTNTLDLKFASEAGGGSAATVIAGTTLTLEKVA